MSLAFYNKRSNITVKPTNLICPYDPFRWADNCSSDFEQMLEDSILDLEAVKELFDEGLITTEELEYAEDYLKND